MKYNNVSKSIRTNISRVAKITNTGLFVQDENETSFFNSDFYNFNIKKEYICEGFAPVIEISFISSIIPIKTYNCVYFL